MFLFFALMAGLLLVLGLIVDQAGEGEATQGCSSQPSAPEEARLRLPRQRGAFQIPVHRDRA
jgi:hypothetical protein